MNGGSGWPLLFKAITTLQNSLSYAKFSFLKKALPICFLAVFFLLQFGKIVAYMECRILAAATRTSTCDCEKLISNHNTSEKDHSPLHHNFSKTLLEELFDTQLNVLNAPAGVDGTSQHPVLKMALHTNDAGDFFQPPRC
jgi:hypothetical protein